jgi:hypothetical protein
MVQVRIISRELNSERTAYIDVLRAELRVDGREIEVFGDRSWVDFDIPVLDPNTGHSVRFEDDPETWARRLPDAYRSGDVLAVVEEVAAATVGAYAQQA